MSSIPPPAAPPNRLLAASRLVHQLWRSQETKVDINQLLEDEAFARSLLQSARVYADPKTSALIDDFERSCIESGAWRTKTVQTKPVYKAGPDGMVSAAAAWDPDYNPPATPDSAVFETVHVPTTSPRTSLTIKERGNSLISRFGFSRSGDAGETGSPPRGSLFGGAPASSKNPSNVSKTPGSTGSSPPDDEPTGPIDPNHKKYVRGAR